jgi:hypothetical protein
VSDKVLKLNPDQGNTLLGGCFQIVFPDKLDKEIFAPNVRARISEDIRQLKKALGSMEVSPIFRMNKIIHFGPADWYDKVIRKPDPKQEEQEGSILGEVARIRYELKAEHKNSTVEVEISGRARKGLAALLLVWAHPGPAYIQSKEVAFTLSPGRQDEVVWTLAGQIGVTGWLQEKLGLTQSNASELSVTFDEDRAKEKELEKAVEENVDGNGMGQQPKLAKVQ